MQGFSQVRNISDYLTIDYFYNEKKYKIAEEMFYGIKFDDLDSLKSKIEEYIIFYNNFRLQSNLKGMAPLEYRHHSSCNYIYF